MNSDDIDDKDDDNDDWAAREIASERDRCEALVKRLSDASDDFRVAMETLTKAGCDQVRLGWLLTAVVGHKGWNRISREEMTDCAERLARAAEAVRTLFFSQANSVLGLNSMRLALDIHNLGTKVATLAPETDARQELSTNRAKSALVRYVQEKTGEYRDNAVAPLIEGALTDAGLMTGTYATASHTQWRSRPGHTHFTAGAGLESVRQLLAAMEAEVRVS